ncbi:MAG: Uma2 family endonuclease [Oscillochloridaceae bacterium umkhey_bin13]
MTAQPNAYLTEAEYLERERVSLVKHEYYAGEIFTLVNPTIIIEILSPSTERYDRGVKFQNYRTIPSLKEYLLVSQQSYRIERFLRTEDHAWIFTDAVGPEATLTLASIQVGLALADVYELVVLPPLSPADER